MHAVETVKRLARRTTWPTRFAAFLAFIGWASPNVNLYIRLFLVAVLAMGLTLDLSRKARARAWARRTER